MHPNATTKQEAREVSGYKMSKEELQGMADKMGIQLNNLCYLKQARCGMCGFWNGAMQNLPISLLPKWISNVSDS